MKKLLITLAGLVAIIGVAIVSYRLAYPTYTYRYRMTVNVDTPQGLRSGSSVVEVKVEKQNQFIVRVPPYINRVRGEAVFIDLGDGKNVVALLASGKDGSNVDFPQNVVQSQFGGGYTDEALRRYGDLHAIWNLPLDDSRQLPTFVTFGDLNDPLTARVAPPDEFESVFGVGVKLRDVTIEMTKDDVTRGIEKKLPWWKNQGRPASLALRAASLITGAGIDAESAFRRNSR